MTKTQTAPADVPGSTFQDLPFSEQFGSGITLRDQEAQRDLLESIQGSAPDQISRGAEEASAAFAKEWLKNPIRSNVELKGRHVVRTPVSFTMPDGTVFTRY